MLDYLQIVDNNGDLVNKSVEVFLETWRVLSLIMHNYIWYYEEVIILVLTKFISMWHSKTGEVHTVYIVHTVHTVHRVHTVNTVHREYSVNRDYWVNKIHKKYRT